MSVRVLTIALALLLAPRELGPVAILDPPPPEVGVTYVPPEFPPIPHNWSQKCGLNGSLELDFLIEDVAREYNLEPALLASVIIRESRCDPSALGASGEIGLAQVSPFWWRRELRKHELIEHTGQLYDPHINLCCAAHILTKHLKRSSGDTWGALRRYNGSGKAARAYADEVYKMYVELKVSA